MRSVLFCLLTTILLCPFGTNAQIIDSVDVTDYDVTLDLSQESPFHGEVVITLQQLRPCSSIGLEFVGVADSVEVAGMPVANATLSALPTAGIAVGQPFTVHVWYHASGWVESYGWGGFHFDNDMSYNLGVGFEADPHVVGRAMFPCRDNFHDKATYTLRVKTKAGWTAECGGICQSVVTNDDGTESSVWRIDQPTPTYLVSVSQSDWLRIHDTISSLYGSYPLTVGHHKHNDNGVRRAFAELDSVVPMFERCFGPYRWGRIGYIATEKGSMEHVNNIALDLRFIASTAERAQTTIAHELGHAWFGNLVTCETEGDMWINEGGASFTSEVAMEAVKGREMSDDYYQRNLEEVLRTAYVTDGGYRALHDMPHHVTYGSTTYNKGWMVWHSLRGYLGETVFYNALNLLMERCAFGSIDAYRLRDSLSLYTGVDLTDFFDFHVFSPGFVDYHVDADFGGDVSNSPFLTVRQQSVGTGNVSHSNRVPVTFFSEDGEQCKLWIDFHGSDTALNVELPFDFGTPAFCVLDLDKEISDAAVVDHISHIGYDSYESHPLVHMALRAGQPVEMYVEHHWGTPDGAMPHTVVRTAKRYWMLRGAWTGIDAVKGYFHFVRTGYTSSDYANLDKGFIQQEASVDSLRVLYRPNSGSSWQILPSTRSGNGNEGSVVADTLLPGEYTIAIVDPNRPAGLSPLAPRFSPSLFPNPLGPGQSFTLDLDTDAPFTVSIFDAEGRMVWQKKDCLKGQKLAPSLTNGTYFVLIENNFISLQSKLIQL